VSDAFSPVPETLSRLFVAVVYIDEKSLLAAITPCTHARPILGPPADVVLGRTKTVAGARPYNNNNNNNNNNARYK